MTKKEPKLKGKREKEPEKQETKIKRAKDEEINQIPTRNMEAGTVYICGNGDCGQLGLGDEEFEILRPTKLEKIGDKKIVQIAAGGMHNLVLTEEGQIYSWGCNDHGPLGRDGEEFEPELANFLDGLDVVFCACSDSLSAVITSDGSVYTFGTFRNSEGVLGFLKGIKEQRTPTKMEFPKDDNRMSKIVCGVDHVLSLSTKGNIYSWGAGQQFQLGRKVMPRSVMEGLAPHKVGLKNIVDIFSGSYHSFAVDSKGYIYVWGLNNYYQLGLGPGWGEEIIGPQRNHLLEELNIGCISGGEHHTIMLTKSGEVLGVGRSDSSQLGVVKSVPIMSNGTVNGVESSHKSAEKTPLKLENLPKIKSIACGTNHNFAITSDNRLLAWGYGEMPNLGTGKNKDEKLPVFIEGINPIDVKCGGQHSLFLVRD